MVAAILHPLNIYILGLGIGFLIPLLNRLGPIWVQGIFLLGLAGMTLISGVGLWESFHGSPPVEILTGGSKPPYSINLRLGLPEAFFCFSINLVALFGAVYFVREKYAVMLLYLILVMGIQGMVMTRDLFNLFVFLEIVSIATYGLLSLGGTSKAFSAAFKYLMATVIASAFFLLGTALLYSVTGKLNIDDLVDGSGAIAGPIRFAALLLLLACVLLELKPFPANGWGLDVYETARGGVAAMVAVGVSAGVFFVLVKLLPLFSGQLEIIAVLGGVTFLFSNLIGLQQDNAQRLLGYSSIGQMGLLTMALALLQKIDAQSAIPLVIGGLFVNHLFAKAGLFWLAGLVGKERLQQWSVLAGRPVPIALFGILLVAIAGLPPFPGFWAKWHLVVGLASAEHYVWIGVVLLGSLLEAAYMFRWFGRCIGGAGPTDRPQWHAIHWLPVAGAALCLAISGWWAATAAGVTALWVVLPLAGGLLLCAFETMPARVRGAVAIAVAAAGGFWLTGGLSGISQLFALLLWAGGIVVSIGTLYRGDARPGFYPVLVVLLLSLPALPRTSTSLEFFFVWELITLSSYFLVVRSRSAETDALRYLLFSLVAAFFILTGFASAQVVNGTGELAALRGAGPDSTMAFLLLAAGLLIKAGAIGLHVWLPGTYAESDDDVSAMLSAVLSKVAMFGLLVGAYVAIRSDVGLNMAHLLGWIGGLTTLAGAVMAVAQTDVKRMLAYSSMSQIGYIVTAIALMSHLGWVTALYLVANHLMVKGILFLAAAAIILRLGSREFADMGGLARTMPVTFVVSAIAIVSMSGLPPLAGFGGKWLLLSAVIEKGWYGPMMLGLLATFVGFVYMARFIQAIFLGEPDNRHRAATEAPLALLVPQYLLIGGILVMSFSPKLLIELISNAIDPHFASTLRWQGMSLEMIYGYWNPIPVMIFAMAVAAALFLAVWWLQRVARQPLGGGFHAFCRRVCTMLMPPCASAFWSGLSRLTMVCAGQARRLYTGDGQTYSLYVVYYFLLLCIVSAGSATIALR